MSGAMPKAILAIVDAAARGKPVKSAEKPVRAAKKRASTKRSDGAMSMAAPMAYKPPTPAQRMKDQMQSAKMNATRDWVDGRISTTKHDTIHKRANHVIRNAHEYARGAGKAKR